MTRKNPPRNARARKCKCNIKHYFNRVKESFNRINRTRQNQGTTNLAFLVLHEIHYIFSDCDRVAAGFVFDESRAHDAAMDCDHILQPLNSCQLASRIIEKDLFQELLASTRAVHLDGAEKDARPVIDIKENGAYRVYAQSSSAQQGTFTAFPKDIPPAFRSGMFEPRGEIFLYVLGAPANSRLYILWQKKSGIPHTCVQMKYNAVCSQISGDAELRSSLDVLFKKHKEKFTLSVSERPVCKITGSAKITSGAVPLPNKIKRPQLDEAVEHFHRSLAEILHVREEDISRDIFFFRALGPRTNDLILHIPPVACRFLFNAIKEQLYDPRFTSTQQAVREKITRGNLTRLLPDVEDIREFCQDIDITPTEDLMKQVTVFRKCFWENNCADHIKDRDVQAIFLAALFKNLSERLPQRRGPLVRAGRQGVPEIIDPDRLGILLMEDDPFSFLLRVVRSGNSSNTAFLFPVLYNERLFGLTVFCPAGKQGPVSRSEKLNTLINFHQANVPFLVQAEFQDILGEMRDVLSISPKGHLETTASRISELLSQGFGVPRTFIFNADMLDREGLNDNLAKLQVRDNPRFLRELSRWIWPGDSRFEYMIAGKLPVLESRINFSGVPVRLYPRIRVVKVEGYRFIIIFLLHRPWKDTPILQKGFIADIASNFGAGLRIRKARHDMLRKGARAAVAAIMGRNMSHNLGSHVLSYWIKRERNEAQSRKLLSYLRHRMDFIAEIATSQPCWSTSMLFCRDVLIPFFSQVSLLDFLGRSEDVHFSSCENLGCPAGSRHARLSFEVYRQTASGQEKIFGWKDIEGVPSWFNPEEKQYIWSDFDTLAQEASPVLASVDIPVSMPHGLTGLHAFYSILENFIRNSVKHCSDNHLDFVVRIIVDDTESDLVRITLEDSRQQCSPEIHERLKKGFSQRLSDTRGNLVPGNWGLKEMKISACYLRSGRTDVLDEETDFQPRWLDDARNRPYISPVCNKCSKREKKNKNHCHVGFILYLLKPKEAMFLASDVACLKVYREKSREVTVVDPAGFREKYMKTTVPHQVLFYPEHDTEASRIVKNNLSSITPRNMGLEQARLQNMPVCPSLIFSVWLQHLCKKHYGEPGSHDTNISVVYRRNGKPDNPVKFNSKRGDDYNFTFRTCSDLDWTENHQPHNGMIILFDEHAEFQDQLDWGKNSIIYYQEVSGGLPVKQIVSDMAELSRGTAGKLRVLEIIESAITRIVVADERIWEEYGTDRENKKIFKAMNLELAPVQDRKLDVSNLEDMLTGKTVDFCIVHLGLLDKLKKAEREKVYTMISNSGAIFVVTSGRGTPYNLPAGARFLEISTLEGLLADRNKFALTQVLYSLRRSQYA